MPYRAAQCLTSFLGCALRRSSSFFCSSSLFSHHAALRTWSCLVASPIIRPTSARANGPAAEPPPINYKTNPYYNTAKADFDYTSPLTPSGSNFPCKGHLADYNAPEGQSVRNYAPGGTYPLKCVSAIFYYQYFIISSTPELTISPELMDKPCTAAVRAKHRSLSMGVSHGR